jgi:hypothetical protein
MAAELLAVSILGSQMNALQSAACHDRNG